MSSIRDDARLLDEVARDIKTRIAKHSNDATDVRRALRWADDLSGVSDVSATRAEAVMLLLSYAVVCAATAGTPDVVALVDRLRRWCTTHDLWQCGEKYALAHALETAVDRFKTTAVGHKIADNGPGAADAYRAACELADEVERHYGASMADDADLAAILASNAHAILGADAFLARRTEAAGRMARLRELHERHPADKRITKAWIEAPLRYVIALAKGFAPDMAALETEVLRARDVAKQHLSASDYKTWRERMAGSINPTVLARFGF